MNINNKYNINNRRERALIHFSDLFLISVQFATSDQNSINNIDNNIDNYFKCDSSTEILICEIVKPFILFLKVFFLLIY